jgi:hypothetical protein
LRPLGLIDGSRQSKNGGIIRGLLG